MPADQTTHAGEARNGFWCWDCRTPLMRATYAGALADADAAGWKVIRGVHRCAACAAPELQKEEQTRVMAAEAVKRFKAGETLEFGPRIGGRLWPSGTRITFEAAQRASWLLDQERSANRRQGHE